MFEFKVVRPDERAKIKLAEALEEIKSRNYDSDNIYSHVRRVALLFQYRKARIC
ncbi:hypothetical protein A4V04_13290 [Burkholderiales bacterium YL45]|uniref:Uncharacterized protein n=1 Tax=Turicimonas muris TaxID=1796652 RepID=A0A227KQ99_9BURK|nr:hypothetical protein A4V04_13290 [Burkholderiales bacterium YL45]OXE50410.1 hypothetical protein ADH67_04200 [Turicimonas muris]QQQ98011.1 hypothetical protein I5Q81_06265 [Turicimonas muris]